MVRPDLNATAEARVKGLVGLRDCVQAPVSYTHLEAADEALLSGTGNHSPL